MNYQTVVRALSLVSGDQLDIATQTQERLTLAQATAAHAHIGSILDQLILAVRITRTRIGEPWPPLSELIAASTISASSTGTSCTRYSECSTASPSHRKMLHQAWLEPGRVWDDPLFHHVFGPILWHSPLSALQKLF